MPNASPNLFNVLLGNNPIYNAEQQGPIQNNPQGFLSSLTQGLSQQLGVGNMGQNF